MNENERINKLEKGKAMRKEMMKTDRKTGRKKRMKKGRK